MLIASVIAILQSNTVESRALATLSDTRFEKLSCLTIAVKSANE